MHAATFVALGGTPAAAAAVRRPGACRRLMALPAAARLTASRALPVVAAEGIHSGSYQQPLTNQERKKQRAAAQRLGKQLCMVNLGQKGLTDSFIEGFRLALAANELVKVKVGSCDESADEIAAELSAAGDCVLVHRIGFTLTFFRDRSLPPSPPYRPRKRLAAAAGAAAAGAAAGAGKSGDAGDAGEEVEEDEEYSVIDEEMTLYLMENEDTYSDDESDLEEEEEEDLGRPNSGRRQAAAARAARVGRPPPPPEFTVIG